MLSSKDMEFLSLYSDESIDGSIYVVNDEKTGEGAWAHGRPMLYRTLPQDHDTRPVMLVVPGGGYGVVCMETEGYPIADKFEQMGYRTFIVRYRVNREGKNGCYPEPQQDIVRAIRMIRAHASEWQADGDHIAVVGFSAGAHAILASALWAENLAVVEKDEIDKENGVCNALLLGYGVITGGASAHVGSMKNLLNEDSIWARGLFALDAQVTEKCPPVFAWHTIEDQVVPWRNTMELLVALTNHNVVCDVHFYPHGYHGTCLGKDFEDIALWPQQADKFLRLSCGFFG